MTKSARARLQEIDERTTLLNLLRSQVPEADHVPKDRPQHVLDECVEDCPACERMSGYTNDLFELGKEQKRIFLEIVRAYVRIDPKPATDAKQEMVAQRLQWLRDAIKQTGLAGDEIEYSRIDRRGLRAAWKLKFKLGDSTFRSDLKALGYDPK